MPQLSPRLIVLLLLAAAAAGVGLISKGTLGGKSDPGDPAAVQVIDRALNNNKFRSGRFEATISTNLQGENVPPQLANALSTTASGVFNGRQAGRPGELDLTMKVNFGRTIEARVVSTGEKAAVSLGGRTYRVTPAEFERSFGKVGRPQEGLGMAALGIDPHGWIENAQHRGTATIGGTATDHVSGKLNVDRILDDLEVLSSRYPRPSGPIPSKEIDEMKNALKGGSFEIYASKRDGTLRKAALHFEMEAKDGRGTFDFAIDFSDVNKQQRIDTPTGGLPLSQLERDISQGTLNPLAAAPSAGSTAAPQTAAPTTAVPSEAQAYLGCVQKAASEPELARCSALLP